MDKQCPFLKAAGYINGKEKCSEECALYAGGSRCSLFAFAMFLLAQNEILAKLDYTIETRFPKE